MRISSRDIQQLLRNVEALSVSSMEEREFTGKQAEALLSYLRLYHTTQLLEQFAVSGLGVMREEVRNTIIRSLDQSFLERSLELVRSAHDRRLTDERAVRYFEEELALLRERGVQDPDSRCRFPDVERIETFRSARGNDRELMAEYSKLRGMSVHEALQQISKSPARSSRK